MTGGPPPRCFDVPHDPSDFGRCYRLLQLAPEWTARLEEVAQAYPAWEPFVREWDKLTAMYEQLIVTGCELPSDSALYETMQQLEKKGRTREGIK